MKFLINSFQKTDLFYKRVVTDQALLESFYADHSSLMQSCLKGHHFKAMHDGGEGPQKFNFNPLPFLLCQSDVPAWMTINETISHIIEKITDAFVSGDDQVQGFFSKHKPFLPFFKKISNRWQTLSRYDVMVDENDIIKFTEFNTSSPGGMLIASAANHALRNYFLEKNINENFLLAPFEQENSFENYIFSLEKQNAIQPETIAFLYDNHYLQLELYEMKERIERHGRKAIVAHVESLSYKNNSLYIGHDKISTIFNNFFLAGENLNRHKKGPWESHQETFLTNHPYRAFFQGIENNASLLIIGFAAETLIEDKSLFCLMHAPRFQYLFAKNEQQFIKKHIPYSRNVDNDFINNPKEMKLALANKNDLVFKINHSALGLGVFMGGELTEDAWRALLEKYVDEGFLQERIYGKKVPAISSHDQSHTDQMNIVFSIYNYSGDYYGMFARISEGSVTNYSRGSFQPVLCVQS